MGEKPTDSTEVKETDIVFDCPHCGKSLAIDYRGAGLTIPCTDCGKNVQVPIPEGMEITDIDSSEEEQEIRILNLRRSMAAAETRIAHLTAEIEALTARRDQLERLRTASLQRFGSIGEKVGGIQATLHECLKALAKIAEVTKEESQPPRVIG